MTRQQSVALYRCPACGAVRLPDGCEEQYGPPECDHGLWFGTGPDGGGEAEMELVEYVPKGSEVVKVREPRPGELPNPDDL